MCLLLPGTSLRPRNKELSPLVEQRLHDLMDYLRRGVDVTPIEILEDIFDLCAFHHFCAFLLCLEIRWQIILDPAWHAHAHKHTRIGSPGLHTREFHGLRRPASDTIRKR
jgi:hypothetical protein